MPKATKLPSGKWRCRAYYTDFDGSYKTKSFTANTKKEAERLSATLAPARKLGVQAPFVVSGLVPFVFTPLCDFSVFYNFLYAANNVDCIKYQNDNATKSYTNSCRIQKYFTNHSCSTSVYFTSSYKTVVFLFLQAG